MPYYQQPPPYFRPRLKPWFLQLSYLTIVAFLLFLPFLHGLGHRPLAVALVALVALCLQLNPRTSVLRERWPIEIKFYIGWALWSLVTGFFIAKYSDLVVFSSRSLWRTALLLVALYAIFFRQCQHRYFFLMLVVLAAVQVVASRLGYHLDSDAATIGGEIVRDVQVQVNDIENTRTEGLTGNANAMAFIMLEGVWACLLLWRSRKGVMDKFKYPILLGLIVLFSYSVIQTASRKSLLVAGVLLLGWVTWMVPGRFSAKSFFIACGLGVVALVVGSLVIDYVMADTMMGKRFQQLLDAGGGSASEGFKENVRYWLYVDGFKMWLHNPICGVGLGHFRVLHWSGLYSHSDYIEPLATTGLVGFILYQGYSFSIVVRIIKLLRRRIPPQIAYTFKGMLLFMLCNHYLIGLGCPWFDGLSHNLIIMFIGTYAWRVWQEYVRHRYIYAT